jgi:hypothetical protein
MIAQFALRLVCGISLMWLLMPRRQITSGFFRIQMLLALALSALAALTLGRFDGAAVSASPLLPIGIGRILCGILAAIAYVGSIGWTLERRSFGTYCVYAVAGLSTSILLASSVSASQIETTVGALTIISELATSLLIGGATAGMLLGHWYLTAPTMSIAPLDRVNLCFGAAAVLRLVVSLVGLVLVWRSLAGGTPLLWLILRWTAGIGGPLVLTAMVWRILRYRNTQAATGVLFVGVIVTFIGELSATLVSRELHVPL